MIVNGEPVRCIACGGLEREDALGQTIESYQRTRDAELWMRCYCAIVAGVCANPSGISFDGLAATATKTLESIPQWVKEAL